MTSKVEAKYIDASSERTRTQFHLPDLTAANIVAQVALANGVRTALNALTLLNEVGYDASVLVHQGSAVPPTNASAQREYGVKLYITDNTNGRISHMFLSGIDPTFLPTSGDQVDFGVTEWAALKTALELTVSRDGNAITVTKGIVTGRRN